MFSKKQLETLDTKRNKFSIIEITRLRYGAFFFPTKNPIAQGEKDYETLRATGLNYDCSIERNKNLDPN